MGHHDPGNLLRGLLPASAWSQGSRLPADSQAKLPLDTLRASRIAAGVHLAFTGSASAIDLTVRIGDRTTVPAPTVPEAFVVQTAGAPAVVADISASTDRIRLRLPERDLDQVVRVYLPESFEVGLESVEAVDGQIAPAPRGPSWVVYGDSISQGWSVSLPGRAWPTLVADGLGLDLVNLGFAGSARGELLTADAVAHSKADVVTLAWGTNAWSSLPTDVAQISATMRLFLTAVRQGLPEAPLIVVSPIVRPAAEETPNRFGATLSDLRAAVEDAVLRFADRTADKRLVLVEGRSLVPPEELVDGIHPGDDGHRSLARGTAPAVASAVGLQVPSL